jgi:hypothetical protein
MYSRKVPVFVRFEKKKQRKYFELIFEIYSNIIFMKIRPVGAELIHADGQTDRHDEINGLFRNFAKRA